MKNLWVVLALIVTFFGYNHFSPEWGGPTEDVEKVRAETEQRARMRAAALPPNFAVPDSFAAAVELLRTVTGSAPEPFVGPRDDGPDVQTTGFSFEVKSDSLAHAIADTAAVLFRAKGFTLFVFGAGSIGVGPGTLVLTPDREPYHAIEAIGTSGGFIFPTTPRVVKWLRALDTDQPFVITGIGGDYIEGRFTTPLKDVRALAKRFYGFCPDIVRQGTRSVANLELELRESGMLYCWWD